MGHSGYSSTLERITTGAAGSKVAGQGVQEQKHDTHAVQPRKPKFIAGNHCGTWGVWTSAKMSGATGLPPSDASAAAGRDSSLTWLLPSGSQYGSTGGRCARTD
jgi:hypothetical protein